MEIPILMYCPEIPVLDIGKKDKEDEVKKEVVKEVIDNDLIICECGGSYTKKGKGGHYRTKVHTSYFKSIA